jgi:hypothetical protein
MILRLCTRLRSPHWAALALSLIGAISIATRQAGADNPFPVKNEAQAGVGVASPVTPSGSPAAIDGFRDAHFGMSEEQVRAVVRREFPAAATSLMSAVNPSEKTSVLSVTVPDLVPQTDNAHISYIFGYRSRKLIQVNIVWTSNRSRANDEAIVGTANALRDYFNSENFAPNSIVANRQLSPNTILVFRGIDDKKRTVLLVLSGVPGSVRSEDKKAPRPGPLTLELAYVEDPTHPDVFRISKGQF